MSQATDRIHELVDRLNQYRHEYYNQDAPCVPDAVYDRLYDELELWEKDTSIILSNSPTQTVGYKAVSSLEKVRHDIPLLSLAKTKAVSDLASFLKGHAALLMLKLDGLTVKLVYEDGRLAEASTRGDGEEGGECHPQYRCLPERAAVHPLQRATCNNRRGIHPQERLPVPKGYAHRKRREALPQRKEPGLRLHPEPGRSGLQGAGGQLLCLQCA